MRRRQFLSFVGGATAWPFAARAQQIRPQNSDQRPLIGVLIFGNPGNDPGTAAFRLGLRELGYVEGRNIAIEFRFADGKPERLPQLAEELVRLRPDVLFVLGGDVAPHLAKATQAIPIVFAMSSDPTKAGLAATLAKPGGNCTGVTFLQDELAAKRVQLLKEVAPRSLARRVLVESGSRGQRIGGRKPISGG